MKTIQWKATEEDLEQAAKALQLGEVVAFPTETVYGLGADARNEAAVAKIFEAKGRPSDNPLIVHVHDKSQIHQYVTDISNKAKLLIDTFMPGALTIILPTNETIATNVTAGLSTVGIRIPDHPVARKLIQKSNIPIAAPSANLSGKPSPTTAEHVYHDLQGKIAGIIDGGATGVGVESTVIDMTRETPIILRPGGVTKEQLEQVIGGVALSDSLKRESSQPKAPGMKYNHYEPNAPLYIVQGDNDFFQLQIQHEQQQGKKVGILVSDERSTILQADHVYACGPVNELKEIAKHLYYGLRFFDETEVDIIFAEPFSKQGIGAAVMNRLEKAATGYIRNST